MIKITRTSKCDPFDKVHGVVPGMAKVFSSSRVWEKPQSQILENISHGSIVTSRVLQVGWQLNMFHGYLEVKLVLGQMYLNSLMSVGPSSGFVFPVPASFFLYKGATQIPVSILSYIIPQRDVFLCFSPEDYTPFWVSCGDYSIMHTLNSHL